MGRTELRLYGFLRSSEGIKVERRAGSLYPALGIKAHVARLEEAGVYHEAVLKDVR